MSTGRLQREREFWDEVIPTLEEEIVEFSRGPEPNTRMMLEAVRPGPGVKVLDFACGTGVTSCWLASVGAEVTGVDLSPNSIDVARGLADHLGLGVEFAVEDVEQLELPEGGFDAVIGRYALHHLDVDRMGPLLAGCLKPGGRAAFLETTGFNPVLRFARDHLIGRFGIPRIGTLDEHPLREPDLVALQSAFAAVELDQADYRFLLMLDRQVVQGRFPGLTAVLRDIDRSLARRPATQRWAFHQVVLAERAPGSGEPLLEAMVQRAPRVFDRPVDERDAHRRR